VIDKVRGVLAVIDLFLAMLLMLGVLAFGATVVHAVASLPKVPATAPYVDVPPASEPLPETPEPTIDPLNR
jgi:hypothetical protein